ncbi:ribonuclease H-like domain-containing protein [Russula ochroleuca]|uniref:Ribonuclease H-like domain-containing protein n=1 Tax=Russula ochroleuca TaxID=152965 RepID=A0A9P5N256_9AGAM|nr:ribonuclease H-like domain-containing protein [Russula ochroleuca]
MDVLQKEQNLTLTFDGNSTRKPQSVYTVHITTKNRDSYFVDGYEGSDERHMAAWIKDKVLKTVREIGKEKFAAVCSDSTGNTKKGRKTIHEEVRTIIDLGDCCHHIQNTIKDINKLSDLREMVSHLQATVKFFSKSNIVVAELRKARNDVDITTGLVKVGKTRFATHWAAASALNRCLPLIRDLVEEGKIKLSQRKKNLHQLFTTQTRYLRFQLQLVQYIAIVGPLAHSLWSLEASRANAADVFIFWLAIASNLKDIFSKSSDTTSISQTLARQVTAIINRRYKAMIDESPSDIYFTAFFLDPRYTRSDVLKKPTTMSVTLKIPSIKQRPCDHDVDAAESVPHARAYTRVKAFLKQMLRDIVETVKLAGHDLDTSNPCHRLVAQLGSNRVVSDFRQQLLAFSCQEWPFTDPITHGDALTWWELLEQHPHARVLAMLAIKIFSVLVNSMPDECTGSKITWFNSPLRANQDVSTLVNMIQIGQWYGVHKVHGSLKSES